MAAGLAVTLTKLWRTNRWLTISFVLTLTLALVFIIRASVFFVYWQHHEDEPVEGWMTIRYVAKSYRVSPKLLHDAIGLPETGPDHRPLIRIARERNQPLDQLTNQIIEAIEAARNPPAPSPASAMPARP